MRLGQTVSNWEKEKNYPDLETLIFMSEEFHISLDVMLKEDKKMAKKLNEEIKFSKKFKKNAIIILLCILCVLGIGAAGWGLAWKHSKNTLEAKFEIGVEKNGFYFDEGRGYYKKVVDQEGYYTLPNQSMPGYFDFTRHFHNTVLDYVTVEDGKNIQIRWSEKQENVGHTIWYLGEDGGYDRTLGAEEEKELCETNTKINKILKEGEKIYESVYE